MPFILLGDRALIYAVHLHWTVTCLLGFCDNLKIHNVFVGYVHRVYIHCSFWRLPEPAVATVLLFLLTLSTKPAKPLSSVLVRKLDVGMA